MQADDSRPSLAFRIEFAICAAICALGALSVVARVIGLTR